MSDYHYGVNVLSLLNELAQYDTDDIYCGDFDVEGESPSGVSGFATVDIPMLAEDAAKMIVALQKKLDAMAAENAALKSGVTYFACGSEYGFDLFKDKKSAIDTCLEEIELHREGYFDGDGWGDEVRKTAWGIVVQSAQGRDAQGLHTSDSQHTYQTCDYRLEDEVKTPATDAYLNSVRAEAVSNFWNSSLRDVAHVLNDIRAFDDSSEAAGIVHSEIKERVEDFVAHLRSGTHDTADKAGAK